MEFLISAIGHNIFSVENIKNKEKEILMTLGFDLSFPTIQDSLKLFMAEFKNMNKNSNSDYEDKLMANINNICIYLAMMAYHEYETLKYR